MDAIVTASMCLFIIACFLGPPILVYRKSREIKYVSGIMTEEDENEWLDEFPRQFQSWEDDLGEEPTLSQLERKRRWET